jgi:hypothetical protein
MLLAIDPGQATGWALLNFEGRLLHCGLNTPPDALPAASRVVVERPRIYPGGRTKNPNDVLSVALNAGEWAGRYQARGFATEYVEPSKWKGGSVPKEISHPRIFAKLLPSEQLVLSDAGKGIAPSKRHNIIDAVGIGLWAAGR